MKTTCPNCREDTISYSAKLRTGYWGTTQCPNCEARLTAFPVLLLVMHMIYVWNVLFFSGMYYFNNDPLYLLYGALGWLVLDFLNVQLIPLAVMKQRS